MNINQELIITKFGEQIELYTINDDETEKMIITKLEQYFQQQKQDAINQKQ